MSSQTWMSGGSGSGVYDPVTTTDNVHFGDGDDKHCKYQVRGGRVYNFGTYRKSGVKAVCDEIRNRTRPRCMFIVFVTTLVLILMMLAVIIAASHKQAQPADGYESWTNKTNGLVFVPWGMDKTVHIRFSLTNDDEINAITSTMDTFTSGYQILKQQSDLFVDCNSTYTPADKVCKQALSNFGKSCSSVSRYGYSHGQPCVLLLLNVPQDIQVRSFRPKDGPVYQQAEAALQDRFSVEHVGVSCKPSSESDAKNVHDKAASGDPIEYFPPKGFPTYVYRKRTTDQFLTPAVMVQFKTIRDFRPTRIDCRAWGVFVDDKGQSVDQDLYITSFVLHIH